MSSSVNFPQKNLDKIFLYKIPYLKSARVVEASIERIQSMMRIITIYSKAPLHSDSSR